MSVQNSSEQANNRVQLHFVDSKNANQITCSSKRPSRMNYAARLNENVYSAGRTIEHDPNLDCRTEDNTTGIHGPYIGVELEETVDYTCKEALQIVGSTCANSTMTQIRAHSYSPSSKEPTSLLGDQTTLTSMPTRSHTKSVPFSKHSNDEGFDKHTSDTSYEFKKVALEAPDCTHVDVDRTIQLPLSSNDSFEHMLVMEESPSLSFLNFPSVFYDEMCMRKNSLLSSSTEKPLSTSALEASGVTNSSSDVCSGLTKLSNDVPDTCKGTSDIFTKEMDYINIPPPNGAAKEEMQRSVNEQEGDSEQSHDSVPDQNVDQQMTCDLYKEQKCATQENSDKELFERETKSKYTVSDSVQIGTPNARVASSVHNYEDTFLLDSPSGTGACTSTPIPESKNMTFFIPGMEDLPEKVKLVANDCELVKDDIKGTLTLTIKAGDGNVAEKAKKPLLAAANRFKKLDMITFPKPNFKNIKPKVMTRPGTQSKESVTSMLSPRSSQSVSTASSPVASPRGPCPSARLGQKAVGEQDLKPEPVMVKSHQQPINKQLFAVAYSKNVLSKLPRTISALKQSRTDADKASSANSACSFASAAAIACIQSCKVIENKTETPKSLSKPDMSLKQMGPEPNKCNGNIGPQLANQELIKASRSDLSEASTTKVPASTKPPPASSKIVQKDYSSTIRSTAVSKAPAVKPKVPPSGVVRRETASKNIVTNANLSPRRSSQPVSNGLDPSTPRGKSTTGQAFALVTARSLTRSLPRSRLPCKESILQRTPSVSSVCSSQSEQSTYSNRSTATSSLKNEVHSTTTRTKDISGPPAAKALVSKSKVQPLKAAQTGTKPKPVCAYQGAPKPSGPIFTARKVPEGKPQSQTGVAGVFGPRYASVEKSKQKASPKTPCTPAQSSPDERKALEFAQCRAKCERQNGFIVQLKQLIVSSNQRFEAVTIVVQQLLKQREEALKQRRALSQELVSLRGDLVTSSVTCEKLEKEKNELQVAYEGILEKLKEQHQSELEELEEKLKEFYTGECKKLQCVFFDEAEKYKTELQGKVDELNATHEAFRLELETSHSETINHLQEKYELSFSELKDTQEHEKSMLEESFTEKQSSLEKTIDELKSETDSLREKLKFEEEQRKIAKEKSNQKNPHVMYLEQELESLKAVMEIKNEKLHQQDKKLMQVEKLVDNNATLFEKLKKCQQENEDLKARMDKHMALSRQLSTEQAVLQESLQKESKVNKRLSMENEELLWKLHNGDLCSPKKLSPTSPSIPFQSSRSSGSFSSPTVSPR